MRALGQWICLESLVRAEPILACQHLLKFISLIGNLAERRARYEQKKQRLVLPGHLSPALTHQQKTIGYLHTAINEAAGGHAREAFTYLFNAFTTLDLPQFRGAFIGALLGDPGPLHKGSGVPDEQLWGSESASTPVWSIVELELQTVNRLRTGNPPKFNSRPAVVES